MPILATRVAGLQVSPQSSCPVPAGLNGIWVDSGTANVLKFRKTDGTDTNLGAGGGGSSTLATAYTNGASQTDSTLSLDATRLGLIVKDAASTVGNLLRLQNNGGTTNYLLVPANASIEVRSGVADGASAVGAILDAANSLANATAKTLSVRNAGTELWYYAPSAQGTAGKGKLKATSADDFWIEAADGNAKLKVSTTAGAVLSYASTAVTLGANASITSGVTDGATAVGTIVDSANSLANATAKTLSVRNAGTELWYYAPSAQGTASKGKFKATSSDDFWFESADGLAKIKCSTTAGTVLNYNNCTLTIGNSASLSGPGTASPLLQLNATSNVASGVAGLQLYPSTYKTYLAMGTGNNDVTATIVEEYLSSGTVTAGEVVVWSGTTTAKTVATAGATANLTTIAGVAITTATNANVQVVTFGRCKAKCAASFAPTAGQLLGTSGTTAGQVTNGAPGAGAIIGRALTGDNTASSGAGFCWVQVSIS